MCHERHKEAKSPLYRHYDIHMENFDSTDRKSLLPKRLPKDGLGFASTSMEIDSNSSSRRTSVHARLGIDINEWNS